MIAQDYFMQSATVITDFVNKGSSDLDDMTKICIETIVAGHKLMICGNGWSAADSQHFAAEIVGTFYNKSRKGLPAIALTTDSSILTAVGNDLWFEQVFARQVEWLWQHGDILIVISTSGNSKNCIQAVHAAKAIGWIQVLGLLGGTGGVLKDLCDYILIAPSSDTPLIQQTHLCIYHWICMQIDQHFSY